LGDENSGQDAAVEAQEQEEIKEKEEEQKGEGGDNVGPQSNGGTDSGGSAPASASSDKAPSGAKSSDQTPPSAASSQKSEQKEVRKESRKVQNLDSGIEAQSLVVKQPVKHWEKILSDSALATSLSPTDIDLARIMTKPRAVPSERQALRLIKVLESAVLNGTIPQSALDK
jgi:hypothetical protein